MQELNEIKKAVDAFMAKAESFIEANKVSKPELEIGERYFSIDCDGEIDCDEIYEVVLDTGEVHYGKRHELIKVT